MFTLVPIFDTISPGFAVPDASTTSLVPPTDDGLKGVGPEVEDGARSQGFGGAVLPAEYNKYH